MSVSSWGGRLGERRGPEAGVRADTQTDTIVSFLIFDWEYARYCICVCVLLVARHVHPKEKETQCYGFEASSLVRDVIRDRITMCALRDVKKLRVVTASKVRSFLDLTDDARRRTPRW